MEPGDSHPTPHAPLSAGAMAVALIPYGRRCHRRPRRIASWPPSSSTKSQVGSASDRLRRPWSGSTSRRHNPARRLGWSALQQGFFEAPPGVFQLGRFLDGQLEANVLGTSTGPPSATGHSWSVRFLDLRRTGRNAAAGLGPVGRTVPYQEPAAAPRATVRSGIRSCPNGGSAFGTATPPTSRPRQPPGTVIRARIGALSLVRCRLCTTRSWWWAAG